MRNFLSKRLEGLQPYVAGEQPKDQKYIKLNTNESPYPPSPKVREAMVNCDTDLLRLYPDPMATEVREAAAEFHKVQTENIFAGNSSDEILAMAFMAFFMNDKPLVYPAISYSFYPVYSDLYKIETAEIPLNDDFSINFEEFPKNNGGVIFPNPNAPTGRAVSLDVVEDVVKSHPDSVVIVDEAYVDFGTDSAVPLTKKYDNLLVIQTLSKSRALAGLRVGFAVGSKGLIDTLDSVKNSFNSYTLDRISISMAAASIKDVEYFKESCNKTIATRERISEELEELGFKVVPSKANFIFCSPGDLYSAEGLYKDLKSAGILIRYWNKPVIGDYCRITVGTDSEMDALISKIKELISK